MINVLPEWAPHKAMWTAWPSHAELWPDILDATRLDIAFMISALARGERVMVLAMGAEAENSARAILQGLNVTIVPAKFGDIWLRDTAPIFARENDGLVALTFRVNGWGGKYIYPHDDEVASFIAAQSGTREKKHDFVLEGGGVEFDGQGRVLTTRSCLLNPNRNPGLTQQDIEQKLRDTFGITQVIWLDRGLCNDHTDGHIDNIARFVGEGRVLCQTPSGNDDPNAATLLAIIDDLTRQGLEVVTLPSPGRITYDDGALAPASHMNYIIGNKTVVVPSYEDDYSARAVSILHRLFPGRDVVASPALRVLTGGGSFHCITQQEPL